ncbi:MAG: ATP-binding protein [Candidatus Saganbacteria bacterium]|nr:ATP-binding protein [Candidatus Saganbacteria bacterium]
MLTTLAIVSIFLEIFSAGILFAGVYTFLERHSQSKARSDLYLAALFFLFSSFIALTIISEVMYNIGFSILGQMFVQKLMHILLTIGALSIWLFICEKFGLFNAKLFRLLSYLFSILCIIFIAGIALTPGISLTFKENTIEPFVDTFVRIRVIWGLLWGIFLWSYLINWAKTPKGGKRNLFLLSGLAGAFFVIAFVAFYSYIKTVNESYLLFSWILNLMGVISLYLGEGISPDAKVAAAPLSIFRTRILYKLILIFVLLIVILLEATTIATINISARSLSRAILASYKEVASGIASKVNDYIPRNDFNKIEKLVTEASKGELVAYIVDKDGRLVAHPDLKRALSREDLGYLLPVKKVLAGNGGTIEFSSPKEFGKRVAAYVPISRYEWGVVVEKPILSAYLEIRQFQTNSLIFAILGIILTVLTGVFFARSIEKPIKSVMRGTEAVGKGDLNYRISIDSIDEIGELAGAFNKMTSDLKEMQDHLVQAEKLASIGTMAAGMAHEIKNPLVSLRTFTQLLQQKWTDEEYRNKFMQIVPNEIERINQIAEKLLKFGRPVKPELVKVNTNSILEEIVSLWESECRMKNIRVTTKLAELPLITGDPGQLTQAFINIIKNAVEAMGEGGELIIKTDVGEVIRLGEISKEGTLKKEAEYKEVSFGEEKEVKPTSVIFIEITDTGPGIPEDNLRSVFDPFFTSKPSGTGMGLPITLRIIEDHGGSIKVRSQVGKGTTFIITLPEKFMGVGKPGT